MMAQKKPETKSRKKIIMHTTDLANVLADKAVKKYVEAKTLEN
tara:strand:+ start:2367 stop:2495 length:129 start_codon:yes stop_codon:yes gene_type:complete